jgi:ribosomal protein L3
VLTASSPSLSKVSVVETAALPVVEVKAYLPGVSTAGQVSMEVVEEGESQCVILTFPCVIGPGQKMTAQDTYTYSDTRTVCNLTAPHGTLPGMHIMRVKLPMQVDDMNVKAKFDAKKQFLTANFSAKSKEACL